MSSTQTKAGRGSTRGPVIGVVLGVGLVAAVVVLVIVFRGALRPGPGAGAGSASRSQAEGPVVADRETVEALLESVQEYVLQNEHAKADAILAGAVRQYVDDQDLRVSYAEFLLQRRRFDEAYGQYSAALAIGPREAELEFAAGTLASMLGRDAGALQHYLAAQMADPTRVEYPLYLAQVQMGIGQLEDAQANLIIASRLDEQRAVIWGSLAEISLRQNALGLARQHIARARDLEPREAAWRVMEARILKRDNDAEGALASLAGIERDALEPDVLRLKSECYGLLGRPADALRAYEEALEASASDGALAYEAALWAERAGEGARALELARLAEGLGEARAAKLVARLEGDG